LSRFLASSNPSKVLRYMRLRPLPPSTRDLVCRVVSTSGSTRRENLLGFGIQSERFVPLKAIGDSYHQRYSGVAGFTVLIA
jgi:hypothetical protein